MTPSQLSAACADGRELAEVLEFDGLEPPLTRRDLLQLFADVLAKIHNSHFTNPVRPEDLYPELRPEDWRERQKRRVQWEDRRLKALAERKRGNGQRQPGLDGGHAAGD